MGLSLRSLAATALVLACMGIAAITALSLAGAAWWPLALLEHVRVHLLLAAIGLAIAATIARHPRSRDAATLAALLHWAALVEIARPWPPPRDDHRIRVVAMNVLTSNRDHAAVAREIAATRPDVLVLIEVDASWLAALADATAGYPVRIERPRADNFGIALYATATAAQAEVVTIGELPSIVATLSWPTAALRVIATHPLPPVSRAAAQAQRRHFATLAALVRAGRGPTVLVGDLNTTPWSREFRALIARSGLRDTRPPFTIGATFPAAWGRLGIPIDHALVSSDLTVVGRAVGPAVGSDHRPIVIDLAIAASR